MTLFRKFVFCATDFYLANGIPEWIFLLHGCRTNQINIYSPKGGSVKPFFGTFLLCFNFLDFLNFLDIFFTRNGIPEWIFLWPKSEVFQGLNGHQR